MSFDPKNILVINLGQIGDVIMSLPAIEAIRKHFSGAKITIVSGTSARTVVEMSGLADDIIPIDRVALRDSGKIWSIRQIIKLISDVRSRNFDFVIDLHSLIETNLLGFFSGAPKRLFASRNNRSLDMLSNFRPRPAPYDVTLHLTDTYLSCLVPLGIENPKGVFRIKPSGGDLEKVSKLIEEGSSGKKKLVGINLGAGHPSRQWSLEKFCGLIQRLSAKEDFEVLVFSGPEEAELRDELLNRLTVSVRHFDKLNLKELAGAFSLLDVVIGNDTGPIHLAGAVGTPVVLIVGENPIVKFIPRAENLKLVENAPFNEISIEDVYEATLSIV